MAEKDPLIRVCEERDALTATLARWVVATGYTTPEEYAASDEVAQHDEALAPAPAAPDFVRDAIQSACARLGMGQAVADKLSERPAPAEATVTEAQIRDAMARGTEDAQKFENLPYGAANELLSRLHERERDLDAANAKIAELDYANEQRKLVIDALETKLDAIAELERDLATETARGNENYDAWQAASARADAAEKLAQLVQLNYDGMLGEKMSLLARLAAANARADAAERLLAANKDLVVPGRLGSAVQIAHPAQKLAIAAFAAERLQCTPAERAVLDEEACGMCGSNAEDLMAYAEWRNAREEELARREQKP